MKTNRCLLLVQFYPVDITYWGSVLAFLFGWIGAKTDYYRVHVAIRIVTPPDLDCTYGLTPSGLFINAEPHPPSCILAIEDGDIIQAALERISFLVKSSVNYGLGSLLLARFGAARYGYTCASFAYFVLTGQYLPNIGTREVYWKLRGAGVPEVLQYIK